MRSIAVITAVFTVSNLFWGCSNVTMLRTQELKLVKQSVDSLNNELSVMQKKILEEQKSQAELLRLMRADQQVRFNEIDRKVSSIEGNLSENQYRLSKIDEKTAEFQKKFDAKLISDSLAGNVKIAEIEKLFQISMNDFNAGRYDIALSGFQDITAKYPDAVIAQDAEYWVAECNYAKKAYSDAEVTYMSYIKKYPQGSKMCVALYKLGLVYDKQNKAKAQGMVWKKLLEQCPDSDEAKVVRSRAQN
ncbi:MAG TPA: tetratricopeptide repeat protein [Chitinispirillaceae bacterium]|nr:tetratricopeptide repeat protein [Chitinispirillaceae bacterium]